MAEARRGVGGSHRRLSILALPALLAGCAELLYGGDTVRVSGTVTFGGLPASDTGWNERTVRCGDNRVDFDF